MHHTYFLPAFRLWSQDHPIKINMPQPSISAINFKYDKDFLKIRTLFGVTDLMCNESNCHGVGHTWNNRHNLLGLFWLMLTTTMVCCLSYVAAVLCQDFLSREIQSQTSVELKGDSALQLPSVVICNRAYFSRRKLTDMGVSSGLTHYLIVSIGSTLISKDNYGPNPEEFELKSRAELLEYLQNRSMSFPELIESISYECEEMVLQCNIGNRRYNASECCKTFVPVRTLTGLCFMHLSSDIDAQPSDGEHMGLTFYFNITRDDWPDLDPGILDPSHTAKVGLQATLISNHTHPAQVVLGKGSILEPRIHSSATITLTVVQDTGLKTIVDLYEQPCLPLADLKPEPGLQNFIKTKPNCDLYATRSCLHQFCNCTLYSLSFPRDEVMPCMLADNEECRRLLHRGLEPEMPADQTDGVSNATRLAIESCLSKARLSCGHLCERHDFTSATSHMPVPPKIYDNLVDHYNLSNGSDLAIMTAFYPDLRYTSVKMWRKDLLNFLCTLGGYTGLFLGCSVLVVCEFFVYVGLVAHVIIRRLIERQKTVTMKVTSNA
ncbi:uncharacterized protein LOC126996936 isoform X2 [Eriocheir sinensis]|uniref:uncharacterized protein LOC126996936 isoform X2 n=1 Tax=Eriocheir sinensis TaxID=95602 RepID=UPI0021C7F61C|nr:uncharacterized protein LOC126996936 isoform X2 [Eriocheir sinensis]